MRPRSPGSGPAAGSRGPPRARRSRRGRGPCAPTPAGSRRGGSGRSPPPPSAGGTPPRAPAGPPPGPRASRPQSRAPEPRVGPDPLPPLPPAALHERREPRLERLLFPAPHDGVQLRPNAADLRDDRLDVLRELRLRPAGLRDAAHLGGDAQRAEGRQGGDPEGDPTRVGLE